MAYVSKIKKGNVIYDIKDNEAVRKSGDTMSGNLIIKYGDIDRNQAPESDIYKSGLSFRDMNDLSIGYVRPTQLATNRITLDLYAYRDVNNTGVSNRLGLAIEADGTRKVIISEAEPWLTALGLSDSGWETITDSNFSGTIYCRKIGKVVYLECDNLKLSANLSAASSKTISGLIPSGYRPGKIAYGTIATTDSTINRVLSVAIGTDGNFTIYSNPGDAVSTSMPFGMTMSYLTN